MQQSLQLGSLEFDCRLAEFSIETTFSFFEEEKQDRQTKNAQRTSNKH